MADRNTARIARGAFGLALIAVVSLGRVTPGRAEISVFAANEVRSASLKDRLRRVRTALKDGTEGARRHSAAITEAFKGTDDWAPATESYYARKGDLVARAAALEVKLDAMIARNAPERSDEVTKALDDAHKTGDVLRSDYEFYMKLPKLADGPQRPAAQAAMRLLAQTGNYPVALAYYLDKTPNRPPFAPLPPGAMPIRHQ